MLEQEFVARHDGLSAVELLLAVPSQPAPPDHTTLTLRLLDADGEQVQDQSWDGGSLVHNDPLRFTFPPLSDSAGKAYHLRLEGSTDNQATVWAFSLDAYPQGAFWVDGEEAVGDLRFQTSYRYSLVAALRDLGRIAPDAVSTALFMSPLVLLPGLALLALTLGTHTARLMSRDPAVLLATAVAGGIPCVALGWLWWSTLGARWSGPLAWGLLGLIAILLGANWRRTRRQGQQGYRFSVETALLAALLLLGLAVRLVAVRDLILPAWVDSPQHYLISRMMADSGRVPDGYRPWMPVDGFWYHYGYHALTATVHLMSGLPIERLMLVGGQLLNGTAPLAVYAATMLLTMRRRAGLLGAFLVSLPSLFPAYFVAWGRYTQLCGLLVLPPLLGLVYRLADRAGTGSATVAWRLGLWCGIVFGGLFPVHARVWVYAAVWAGMVALLSSRRWRALAGVAAVGVACAAPWWARVGHLVLMPLVGQGGGGSGTYNDIPWGYLTYGWERVWLALAGIGLLWAVWRRKRHVLVVGGWVAAVFAVINLERLGLPTYWLVNNNTWLISLFVPVATIVGWALDDGWRRLETQSARRMVSACGMAALLVWSGLFGVGQGSSVVTEQTTLTGSDDLALFQRAQEILPKDTLVAVNAWPWMGPNAWAGSDGGYWLMPLTGVETTMPPIGYNMAPENRDFVNAFNRSAYEVADWDVPEALALLRERGVTHIFVGERGGTMRPEVLLRSEHYRLLAQEGAAWLIEVVYSDG